MKIKTSAEPHLLSVYSPIRWIDSQWDVWSRFKSQQPPVQLQGWKKRSLDLVIPLVLTTIKLDWVTWKTGGSALPVLFKATTFLLGTFHAQRKDINKPSDGPQLHTFIQPLLKLFTLVASTTSLGSECCVILCNFLLALDLHMFKTSRAPVWLWMA